VCGRTGAKCIRCKNPNFISFVVLSQIRTETAYSNTLQHHTTQRCNNTQLFIRCVASLKYTLAGFHTDTDIDIDTDTDIDTDIDTDADADVDAEHTQKHTYTRLRFACSGQDTFCKIALSVSASLQKKPLNIWQPQFLVRVSSTVQMQCMRDKI